MAKKILLIESDGAFAHEMSAAIEARGCAARVTADGKEGLDLARVDRPDLIVLCVELPKMSGYSVCNKLKKDDELRSIPLLIISAEATPETFDQHRKLKKDPNLKDVPLIIMSSESSDETFEQHKKLRTRADDFCETIVPSSSV